MLSYSNPGPKPSKSIKRQAFTSFGNFFQHIRQTYFRTPCSKYHLKSYNTTQNTFSFFSNFPYFLYFPYFIIFVPEPLRVVLWFYPSASFLPPSLCCLPLCQHPLYCPGLPPLCGPPGFIASASALLYCPGLSPLCGPLDLYPLHINFCRLNIEKSISTFNKS